MVSWNNAMVWEWEKTNLKNIVSVWHELQVEKQCLGGKIKYKMKHNKWTCFSVRSPAYEGSCKIYDIHQW